MTQLTALVTPLIAAKEKIPCIAVMKLEERPRMTEEIRLAFAHPLERVQASAEGKYDRISLRDHIVEVEIGAFQSERGVTQRVCFNVVVEVRPAAEYSDDVDQILSYDRVTEAIAAELNFERLNLLETLAERIAGRILSEKQAVRAFVRIEKLDRGPGALGVEIVRSSTSALPAFKEAEEDRPRPRIIHLSNLAVTSPFLTGWLDALEHNPQPVILCVGLPELPQPKAENVQVARRIGLLAIEQNAWLLAAQDPRCVVVATHTELDWAMKNGQISVWAPSKMVLDATHPPQGDLQNSLSLTRWLVDLLEAQDGLYIGAEAPIDPALRLRSQPIQAQLL